MSSAGENYRDMIEAAFGEWKPENFTVRRKVRANRILVASDAHLPRADRNLLARMRAEIHRYGIECVVWLGDLMDMHTFSHYGITDYSISYQEEKKIVSNILVQVGRDLERTGGYQMISRGNHDHRWIKKLDNQENMEGLVRSISDEVAGMLKDGQIDVSDNPTLDMMPDGKDGYLWTGTHPAQFKAPFGTPGKMALHEQRSVIAAHAHHFGYTVDETNKFWVVEAGGLFDDTSFEYVQRNPTTMRRMSNGFWILIEDEAPIGMWGRQLDLRAAS